MSNMILFTCSQCSHEMQLSASLVGKQGKCPSCKQVAPIVAPLQQPMPVAPSPTAWQQQPIQQPTPVTPPPAAWQQPPTQPVHGDDTILIHQVFSPQIPWPLSESDIPVQLIHAQDGNPLYLINIEGIELYCFEITTWEESATSRYSPRRFVVATHFEGVEITNPLVLLHSNYITKGFPSFGIDEDEMPTMQISIPISQQIPLEILRNQLLVAIGILAEEAADFWQSISGADDSPNTGNVALAVGSLLGGIARGFLG